MKPTRSHRPFEGTVRTRWRLSSAVTTLAMVISLATTTTNPAGATTACVPVSTSEMKEIVQSFVYALTHPESAPFVPLADDFRKTTLPTGNPRELGGMVARTSGLDQRAELMFSPTLRLLGDHGNMRWVIDEQSCEAILLWLLQWQAGPVKMTIHLAERFRISNGLIEEIEEIGWRSPVDDGSCWPAATAGEGPNGLCLQDMQDPPEEAAPQCESSRNEMIGAAQTYLDAIESHGDSETSLAADARRSEMPPPLGGPVTTSKNSIMASLRTDSRFVNVVAVRQVHWFIDPVHCQVLAFHLSDDARRGTVHHATRFGIDAGMIREIEDISYGPVDPSKPEGSCWPQLWSDAEDEIYRVVACPA